MLMRRLLAGTQLRALAYVHFCNNWFHYTMLAWLPTYFTDTLDLNLSQAAQARCLAPSLVASPAICTCCVSHAAHKLSCYDVTVADVTIRRHVACVMMLSCVV